MREILHMLAVLTILQHHSPLKNYAIVDVETTGGITNRDRITEIVIVIFDGEKVIDKYETLINPE